MQGTFQTTIVLHKAGSLDTLIWAPLATEVRQYIILQSKQGMPLSSSIQQTKSVTEKKKGKQSQINL